MNDSIDILMITYNRPAYTRLTLPRLLETCDPSMRVWVWHNGDDPETLDAVRNLQHHPRFHALHVSRENVKLREPTNWFFRHSDAAFLAKVDDDCLMPMGWADALRRAHQRESRLGVIACWHFSSEDFDPSLAQKKIKPLDGDTQILLNCWTPGSGFLMKRQCVDQHGLLDGDETFTDYCIRLARSGWLNGWHIPLIIQEHLDDPRSEHCQLSDADAFQRYAPLSARNFGSGNLLEWQAQLRRSARLVQEAPADPRMYSQWRRRVRRGVNPIRRLVGMPEHRW